MDNKGRLESGELLSSYVPQRYLARQKSPVLVAWVISRGLMVLMLLWLAVTQGRSLTAMLSQWDVQHFAMLAETGYLGRADGTLMAFFPGLPLLFRLGLIVGVPVIVTGVVLSAIASYAAALALARLGGPVAAIAWLFAPTAVFTLVPYTEAAFCAAAFWAWERARRGHWAVAAVLAGLACTMRVSGLFLVGALVVLALTSAGSATASGKDTARSLTRSFPRAAKALLWLLIPAAVVVAFASYLHALTGSWTAWYRAQTTGWARELTTPWQSLLNTLAATHSNPEHPLWPPVFAAEIVSMAIGVIVVVWCLRRRLLAEASWVAVQLLAFSISYWFMSVNRAILLWFPLWIMIASLVAIRSAPGWWTAVRRTSVMIAFAVEIGLMLTWTWLYATGNWAS